MQCKWCEVEMDAPAAGPHACDPVNVRQVAFRDAIRENDADLRSEGERLLNGIAMLTEVARNATPALHGPLPPNPRHAEQVALAQDIVARCFPDAPRQPADDPMVTWIACLFERYGRGGQPPIPTTGQGEWQWVPKVG
jgi:hypothetical protein